MTEALPAAWELQSQESWSQWQSSKESNGRLGKSLAFATKTNLMYYFLIIDREGHSRSPGWYRWQREGSDRDGLRKSRGDQCEKSEDQRLRSVTIEGDGWSRESRVRETILIASGLLQLKRRNIFRPISTVTRDDPQLVNSVCRKSGVIESEEFEKTTESISDGERRRRREIFSQGRVHFTDDVKKEKMKKLFKWFNEERKSKAKCRLQFWSISKRPRKSCEEEKHRSTPPVKEFDVFKNQRRNEQAREKRERGDHAQHSFVLLNLRCPTFAQQSMSPQVKVFSTAPLEFVLLPPETFASRFVKACCSFLFLTLDPLLSKRSILLAFLFVFSVANVRWTTKEEDDQQKNQREQRRVTQTANKSDFNGQDLQIQMAKELMSSANGQRLCLIVSRVVEKDGNVVGAGADRADCSSIVQGLFDAILWQKAMKE